MSLSTISASKMSSASASSSLTERSCTNDSAASVAEAMSSMSSEPLSTNFSCLRANPLISRVLKYLRLASPTARWNRLEPRMIVLSTSKNAAEVEVRCSSERAADAEARPARR